MGDKSKGGVSRREAINRIVSLVAFATGMSISEVRFLLAAERGNLKKPVEAQRPGQVQKPLNRISVVEQKSANDKVKALKVLLENDVEVFENEYGRTTPIRNVQKGQLFPDQNLPPDMAGDMVNVCGTNFDPGGFGTGATGLAFCSGVNTCTGQDLTGSGGGNGQPCDGVNTCNGQSCPKQRMCGDNTCEDQSCPKFDICDKNNESLTTADFLSDIAHDAYVDLLLQEFNVTSVEVLHNQLNRTLRNISTGKAVQWPPK